MKNHWNGKTWYAYGTSMTSVEQGEFVPVVADILELNIVNRGISGGSLTPDGYGKGNNKLAVMNIEDGKENADLITLEVLPNEVLQLVIFTTLTTCLFAVASTSA